MANSVKYNQMIFNLGKLCVYAHASLYQQVAAGISCISADGVAQMFITCNQRIYCCVWDWFIVQNFSTQPPWLHRLLITHHIACTDTGLKTWVRPAVFTVNPLRSEQNRWSFPELSTINLIQDMITLNTILLLSWRKWILIVVLPSKLKYLCTHHPTFLLIFLSTTRLPVSLQYCSIIITLSLRCRCRVRLRLKSSPISIQVDLCVAPQRQHHADGTAFAGGRDSFPLLKVIWYRPNHNNCL